MIARTNQQQNSFWPVFSKKSGGWVDGWMDGWMDRWMGG